MGKKGSWKNELDIKYHRLMNTGDIRIIDKTNDIICKTIEQLDQIQKEIKL